MKNWMTAAVILLAAAGSVYAQQPDVRLEEVVVTATKTEKDPKDVTQSVTVLTGEEIRKTGAITVAEAVRTVAGLSLNDQGPVGALTSVSLRGSSYSQVLVLLDGARLNSPRDSGVDLSALPVVMDDIERIEIVRGPGSALYGADAVSGVVNIITKRPKAGYVSRAGGAVGSHGYDSLQLGTSGKQGATLYSFSGERGTSDGYRTNSDDERWTAGGRLGYDVGKGAMLDITMNYASKENGVPGSTVFGETPHARQLQRTTVLGASFRQKIGKELELKLSSSQTDDALQYHDPDYFMGPLDSRHESTSRASELQATWVAAPWSVFTLGYEARRNSLESTDSGQHAVSNNAWYIQDEIPAGESFLFVVGQRYDDHSVYGDQWSSRASGRYLVRGSGTIIRLSYGESFRGPTFNDLYWSDPFSTGNPDLKPEKAKEYEAGIEQSLGGGSTFRSSYFERKVSDLIVWNFMTFPMRPENIGKATIKGVEAETELRFSETAVFALNYAYMNPIDDIAREKIYSTISPKNQIKGRLTVAVDADVYITAEGRSVENYVRPGDPVWKYSVYDAKIAQKIGKKGAARGEIYFAMTNLFDRKYENAKGYPMPPREIRGGLTVPF
jgi:outer membrane cobalamin receptor